MSTLWQRQKGESEQAYRAFILYRDLGLKRSLARLRQEWGESGVNSSLLERWSSAWKWVDRCRAFDNWIQAHRDKVVAEEAEKWERRRQAELERGWQLCGGMQKKAREILEQPLYTKTTNADGSIAITPNRWSFGDAVALLRLGFEGRNAILEAVTTRPEDLSDVERQAILSTLDVVG